MDKLTAEDGFDTVPLDLRDPNGLAVLATTLCLLRLVRRSPAQDRVLAMDLICTIAMLVLIVLAPPKGD